jgi:16S rRNA (cytosine967-C5)-methyltransferase
MQNDILSFAAQQKKILQQASAAVKRGGRLIYCTCSVLPEENENIVEHFLRVNNQFSLGKPSSTIIRPLTDSSGFFRTFPHRHNMDGFFGALLIRQ